MTTTAENIKNNKEALYGQFWDSQQWRTKWAKKAAYQALDLRDDDDMQVNTVKNSIGVTWKELLVVGGLLVTSFGLYQHFNSPTEVTNIQQPGVDTNSQYTIGVDHASNSK